MNKIAGYFIKHSYKLKYHKNMLQWIDWTTEGQYLKALPGFEISLSQWQNGSYFSIIVKIKKSYFTVFVMQNFEQNTKKKNTFELHLHCLNHVCKVNEKSLVDYF